MKCHLKFKIMIYQTNRKTKEVQFRESRGQNVSNKKQLLMPIGNTPFKWVSNTISTSYFVFRYQPQTLIV